MDTRDWGKGLSWEMAFDDYTFEYDYFPDLPDSDDYMLLRNRFKELYESGDEAILPKMDVLVAKLRLKGGKNE